MPRTKDIPRNLAAFLDMIGISEGTTTIPESDDGYNVLVGATRRHPLLFDDYSKHPEIYNPKMNSTAAGRYQIIRKTWRGIVKKLNLPDFSPESQDRAAIELIRQRGAYQKVITGFINDAISLCSKEWASLPGAGYGQHENDISVLLAAYRSLGGETNGRVPDAQQVQSQL